MERGEDERHLPRREYVGRQTDVRDGERKLLNGGKEER